ncbi:MAG: HyaD/HybD family hydrogenase maturation endopeptidase [Gemmatimonadales bacterium]
MPMTPEADRRSTVILGLGNPLMGDDGLGLAVLERLRREWDVPPGIELVDGGTWGMNLLPLIEDADRLILIDAIRGGVAPGDLITLERDQLPMYIAHKFSPHQVDLKEVLALAELRGTLAEETVAFGAEPALVELQFGLSPLLETRVDAVAQLVIDRLVAWGHECEPRVAVTDA